MESDQPKKGNWFRTHPVLSSLVGLALLSWIGSTLNNGRNSSQSVKYNPTQQTSSASHTVTPAPTPILIPLELKTDDIYTPGRDCLFIKDTVEGQPPSAKAGACVTTGDWRGYVGITSIPIIGKVYGDVKRITINNQDVTWDDSTNEIYTRLNLNVQYGLNQYKVVATDQSGNSVTKDLYMTSVNPNDNSSNSNPNP